jgi:nucleotidyltransferase/DNA polymerase involved in DNA repair
LNRICKNRAIIHLDLDSFFCSVEVLINPAYKDQPIVVGGTPEKRGVVASASYKAREYGIYSAMSSYRARQLCEDLIILPPNFKRYRKYSRIVMGIAKEETEIFEQVSVDEIFLDLTNNVEHWNEVIRIGKRLQKRIHNNIGLSASFGIGTNKLVTKVASDFSKPNGFVVVYPGDEKKFLSPLPVTTIPGIGKSTAIILEKMNIKLVRDLQKHDEKQLLKIFGRYGHRMIQLADGINDDPVYQTTQRKSISSETTFPDDIDDLNVLKQKLKQLVKKICQEMVRTNLYGRVISLKIRFSDFTTINRQFSMQNINNSEETIYSISKKLLIDNYESDRSVRLIGVSIKNLQSAENQLDIFK